MQSCLEKTGIEERNKELANRMKNSEISGYTKDNEYSYTHEDARATGDKQGKGTGHGGHTHSLPNCDGPMGVINYSNFDTDIESNAGNSDDNKARIESLVRSKYTNKQPYSAKMIDTSENIKEGQYFVK